MRGAGQAFAASPARSSSLRKPEQARDSAENQAEAILYGSHERHTPSFMPEMVDVVSSNIDKVGYDPAGQALHVVFNSSQDSCYVWTEVPEDLHLQLMRAESKGKFLNQHLVGKYPRVSLEI